MSPDSGDTKNSTEREVHLHDPDDKADLPTAPKGRIETKRQTLEAMAWLRHSCTMSRVQ